MVDVDNSELDKLATDLGRAGPAAGPFVAKAVEVTARNVRDTGRQNASGMAHAPAFPHSITYDLGAGHGQTLGQAVGSVLGGAIGAATSTTFRAEIGPDKGRAQGALGNLIEFGSVNNPPQGIMHGALQANEADFERGIDKAIGDALKKAGL